MLLEQFVFSLSQWLWSRRGWTRWTLQKAVEHCSSLNPWNFLSTSSFCTLSNGLMTLQASGLNKKGGKNMDSCIFVKRDPDPTWKMHGICNHNLIQIISKCKKYYYVFTMINVFFKVLPWLISAWSKICYMIYSRHLFT